MDGYKSDSHCLLSAIIPCLNEAEHLPELITALQSQSQILEVLVADGGSTDNSLDIAKESGVTVVQCPKGRAKQMNLAAEQARGRYLLFLHADSKLFDNSLIKNALQDLEDKLEELDTHKVAGHFALKFSGKSEGHQTAYRYMEDKSEMNRPNTTNGDQGLLLHKNFFNELGGFDDSIGFLEDQIIAEKIRQEGQWITLPGCIGTSARRFARQGHHRLYIFMGFIMGLHSTGYVEFFARAPELYKVQAETEKLKLWPFFRLTWQIGLEKGFWWNLHAWFKVGRYIRQNSWQMFYFFDQLLRPVYRRKIFPLLKFHDKVFYPITNNAVCDGINTIFSFFWFGLVLPAYFYIMD